LSFTSRFDHTVNDGTNQSSLLGKSALIARSDKFLALWRLGWQNTDQAAKKFGAGGITHGLLSRKHPAFGPLEAPFWHLKNGQVAGRHAILFSSTSSASES